jgi:hypothetical protein
MFSKSQLGAMFEKDKQGGKGAPPHMPSMGSLPKAPSAPTPLAKMMMQKPGLIGR